MNTNEVMWWPYINEDGRTRFFLFCGPTDRTIAPRFLTKQHALAYAKKRGWTVR